MSDRLGHLSSRFFDVLLSSPLTSSERATIDTWLPPDLRPAFYDQATADQRHGYEAGLTVLAAGGAPTTVIAAVMHDIGKRRARLGLFGRTAASLLIKLGLPLTSRMRLYRDHGLSSAKELSDLGAPPLAIDFALHHHGERPDSIDEATWQLLVRADEPKARMRRPSGISSRTR